MQEESESLLPFIRFFSEIIKKFIQSQKLEFYDVQKKAIKFINQYDNFSKNLVITAPTGSGKTLVFILTILKYLHQHYLNKISDYQHETNSKKQNSVQQFKVIFVAPTRAVCNQKFKEFTKICKLLRQHHKINLKVFKLSAQNSRQYQFQKVYCENNIFICTPEMANVLYRIPFVFQKFYPKLFLCDEIHLLGDKQRGSKLEMVLTKTLSYQQKEQLSLRIVCVSATIKNLKQLAKWLKGRDILSKIRQVTLRFKPQTFNYQNNYGLKDKNKKQNFSKQYSWLPILKKKFQQYSEQSWELDTHQRYLIFCYSKSFAKNACKKMFLQQKQQRNFYKFKQDNVLKLDVQSTIDLIKNNDLKQCIQKRVAYYHAYLPELYKNIIIQLMKKKWILAIFSTSTLAQGVNLPVQVVIIMGLNKYEQTYTKAEVEQMIGRGGRNKSDKISYCTLIEDEDVRKNFDEEIKRFVEKNPQEGPIFQPQQIRSNVQSNFDEFMLFEFAVTKRSSIDDTLQNEKQYFFKNSLWAKQLLSRLSEKQVKAQIGRKLKETTSRFKEYDLRDQILDCMYGIGISVKSYIYIFKQILCYQGEFNELKFLETICNIDQIVTNFRYNKNQDFLGQYKEASPKNQQIQRILVPYKFKASSKNQKIKDAANKQQQQKIRRKRHRSKAIFLLQVYLKGQGNKLLDHLFEEAEQIARVVKRVCQLCQSIYSFSNKYKQNKKQAAGFVFWNQVYLKYLSLLPNKISITMDNYLQNEERASHLNIKKCWKSIMPAYHGRWDINTLSQMKNKGDQLNPNFFKILKTALKRTKDVKKALENFDLKKSQNEDRTFIVDSQQKLKYFIFEKQNDTFTLSDNSYGFQESPKIKLKQTNNIQYIIIVYEKVLGTDAIYKYQSDQGIKKFQFPQDYNNVDDEVDENDEDEDDSDDDSDDDGNNNSEKRSRRGQSKSRGKSSSLDKICKKLKK